MHGFLVGSKQALWGYLDGVKQFNEYMQASNPDDALRLFAESVDRTEKLNGFINWSIVKGCKPININAPWQGVKKWLVGNSVNGVDCNYISRPKRAFQIETGSNPDNRGTSANSR